MMKKKISLMDMKAVIVNLQNQVKKLARLGPRLIKTEKELEESKRTFEKRVNVRTAAERIIHRQLHGEIKYYEQVEQSLEIALEYANSILNTIRSPFVILDEELKIVSANPAFYKIFKVTPENTEEQCIYDLGNRQWDIPKLRKLLEDIILRVTNVDNFEVSHNFPSIGKKTMLLNACKIINKTSKSQFILLAIEDITRRRDVEEKLNALAHHDELTSCVNYRSILSVIEKEIQRSKRYKKCFSIIMMDLNNFKKINDTYGHSAGNDVLIAFANGVKQSLRNIDILGRYGGDEFVILLPETNYCQASVLLERVKAYFRQQKVILLKGESRQEIVVQFSEGMVVFPDDGKDVKELIEAADSALY